MKTDSVLVSDYIVRVGHILYNCVSLHINTFLPFVYCLIKRYLDCYISLSKSVSIYLLYHCVKVLQHKLYNGCTMGKDCCHTFDPFRLFFTGFLGEIQESARN